MKPHFFAKYLVLAVVAGILSFSSLSFAASYKSTLRKWTRSDRVYKSEDLNATLLWTATLLSPEMVAAQKGEFARVYDTQDISSMPLRSDEDGILFYISFYSEDSRHDDLSQKGNAWQLRLKAGDEDFAPIRVEKVDKPAPLDRLFYPYMEIWSRGYYVWFPREARHQSKPWTLSVHGPFSHSKLIWKN